MADLVVRGVWASKEQASRHLNGVVLPFARSQIAAGYKLYVEVGLQEDSLTDRQRGYYHGVILKEISQQAAPMGVKHNLAVWKEYFRAELLGWKTRSCVNPVTGKKSRRRVRISTEDLGVRAYANLIDQVTAYAVTELGVRFSMDFAQWQSAVDAGDFEV